MELAHTFLNEIFALLGYALLIAGVYKIFQVDAQVKEIKELIEKSARSSRLGAASPVVAEDSASEYAENLLRALQAESKQSENEPQNTP